MRRGNSLGLEERLQREKFALGELEREYERLYGPLEASQRSSSLESTLYPRDLPDVARARVEAERLKGAMELEQQRKQVPWSKWGPGKADEENLRRYILRVFRAFALEICELGAQGRWTVERIRSEADEFLRRFTIEAYYDDGHDKNERKLRKMVSHLDGSILPDVQREFRRSTEWGEFTRRLLAVAEAAGDDDKSPSARKQAVAGKKPNPLVAARRSIVKANRALSSSQICKRLDADGIPSPENWENFPGWSKGLRDSKFKCRIWTMIGKDKARP